MASSGYLYVDTSYRGPGDGRISLPPAAVQPPPARQHQQEHDQHGQQQQSIPPPRPPLAMEPLFSRQDAGLASAASNQSTVVDPPMVVSIVRRRRQQRDRADDGESGAVLQGAATDNSGHGGGDHGAISDDKRHFSRDHSTLLPPPPPPDWDYYSTPQQRSVSSQQVPLWRRDATLLPDPLPYVAAAPMSAAATTGGHAEGGGEAGLLGVRREATMPLPLTELRRTQRRLAALFGRQDTDIEMPKIRRRRLFNPAPHFCVCSRLDPTGRFRDPALDYLRQGLLNAGREPEPRACLTDRTEKRKRPKVKMPLTSREPISRRTEPLPQPPPKQPSFVTSKVKDPYTGQPSKAGILNTNDIQQFDYDKLKEDEPKESVLPPLPPAIPVVPDNTPVNTAEGTGSGTTRLPLAPPFEALAEEDEDTHSSNVLTVQHELPEEGVTGNSQQGASPSLKSIIKSSVGRKSSSSQHVTIKSESDEAEEEQPWPESSGYSSQEVDPAPAPAPTPKPKTPKTPGSGIVLRQKSHASIERVRRSNLSVQGSGRSRRSECCNSRVSAPALSQTSFYGTGVSITPLSRTPERPDSGASSEFIRYQETLSDSVSVPAFSPEPPPPPPKPVTPADVQLEETPPKDPTPPPPVVLPPIVIPEIRIPTPPPPLKRSPSPDPIPVPSLPPVVPQGGIYPDGAREAYIKALAVAAARHKMPLEPWWEHNISRSWVFSYYDDILPTHSYCDNCIKPHLKPPPKPIKNGGKKAKKFNAMKHIFKDVKVDDYYPGMAKNPIVDTGEEDQETQSTEVF